MPRKHSVDADAIMTAASLTAGVGYFPYSAVNFRDTSTSVRS